MITSWIRAFLLTQMIEIPIHAQAPGLALPWRRRLAVAFAASAMTHPMVWFVIPGLVFELRPTGDYATNWWIHVAISEVFAVVAEGLWLSAFGVRLPKALAWSLFANLVSFSAGLFCYEVLGW
ncbi:MAG: hypothetical protein RLO52_18715 [Sandaracinaceae bacterium]|nr:hypothetical protein [Myxococcales bacterium]